MGTITEGRPLIGKWQDPTPSMRRLIEIGEPILPRMLDLLEYDGGEVRWCAYIVVRHVLLEMHGFVFGGGWPSPEVDDCFHEFWVEHGGLRPDSTPEEQVQAARLLRRWLATRGVAGQP